MGRTLAKFKRIHDRARFRFAFKSRFEARASEKPAQIARTPIAAQTKMPTRILAFKCAI